MTHTKATAKSLDRYLSQRRDRQRRCQETEQLKPIIARLYDQGGHRLISQYLAEKQLTHRHQDQAARRRRKTAECGTPSGYARHLRVGEPACPECRYAMRLLSRRRTQKSKTGITCDAPEPCSPAGYQWHVSQGERPCPACIRYTDGVPVFDVDKARRDLERYLRARRARKGRARG